MGRIMILLLLIAAPVWAADPDVTSGADQKKTTENTQEVTREKNISLERSASDKTADAIEKIKQRTFSTDYLKEYTSRADTQGAVVLIPFITALERGELDIGKHKVVDLFRRCGLYTYPHPIPSALFLSKGSFNFKNLYGTPGVITEVAPGTPLHISVSGADLYKYDPEMERKPQRFAPASEALRCYMGYGYVMSETIKEMAAESIGTKPQTNGSAQTFFVMESLEKLAARALVAVIADPKTITTIDEMTKQKLAGSCMLPTIAALNQGNFLWSCGGIEIDPTTGMAKQSGTPYFGDNTFLGVSAVFAQVDSVALTNGLSRADMERYSKVNELAQAKSTRLSKRRGQAMGTGTADTVSAGSGVSQ